MGGDFASLNYPLVVFFFSQWSYEAQTANISSSPFSLFFSLTPASLVSLHWFPLEAELPYSEFHQKKRKTFSPASVRKIPGRTLVNLLRGIGRPHPEQSDGVQVCVVDPAWLRCQLQWPHKLSVMSVTFTRVRDPRAEWRREVSSKLY